MARPGPLSCVTDKELYDALMSSKQQFNAGSLLELARGRGILLSSADDRAALADRLSAMIFGCEDIQAIQAAFETAGRDPLSSFASPRTGSISYCARGVRSIGTGHSFFRRREPTQAAG